MVNSKTELKRNFLTNLQEYLDDREDGRWAYLTQMVIVEKYQLSEHLRDLTLIQIMALTIMRTIYQSINQPEEE